MENASKALIIAGAILLAILIIGLGVFIFSKAQGAMGDVGLDEQKLTAINSKFEQYEGTKVSGSDVRSLMDLVRTNNNQYEDDEQRDIKVAGSLGSSPDAVKKAVATGKYYSVSLKYRDSGPTKGYVSEITIGQ